MQLSSRQYIFCRQALPIESGTRHIRFLDYNLYYGADLDVTCVQKDGMGLLLIGYILDPYNPKDSDTDILERIADKLQKGWDITQASNEFGGRWALVVWQSGQISVFHDACGLRQVFYYADSEALAFASQARLLAQVFSLKTEDSATDYINQAQKLDKEYSWPVSASTYKDVKRLLPNHYIKNNRSVRFWPERKKTAISAEEASKKCATIIKGLLNAANERFTLAVTLTAGLDTRLVLAGCADILYDVSVVTLFNENDREFSDDIAIPRQICKALGIKHHAIKCRSQMSEDFECLFRQHSEEGHPYWGTLYEAVGSSDYADHLWVKGSCCEAARNPFGLIENRRVTAKLLCELFDIPATAFALGSVDQWLNDARRLCDELCYNLMDLFYWEHRMGSWQGMCQNEADIIQETFTPFNIRELLELLLMTDEAYRVAPEYRLFRMIIKRLLPTLLDYPINPKRNTGLKRKALTYIKKKYPMLYIVLLRMKKR